MPYLAAFRVIAFTDVVGYACSIDCADAACHDINADHGDADAGYEPTDIIASHGIHCMGCGKVIKP